MNYLKLLSFILILSSCTQTFYIVRHAEKADNSNDPELSQAGRNRAVRLEQYMADKNLDTVFTSDTKRSKLTGLSVALPQVKPLIVLDQTPETKLNEFITRLRKINTNKNILVVGHKNTIPKIVFDLCGVGINEIGENEYDNIYIITRSGNQVSLNHIKY